VFIHVVCSRVRSLLGSRSAESASESVTCRDDSESWWGTTRHLYAARLPTSVTSVPRPSTGQQRGPARRRRRQWGEGGWTGHGGAALQPACAASQPAAAAYRGKLAGRSVPTDRGACWGLHRFCAALTPAGPGGRWGEREGEVLLAGEERARSRSRARAGGDTSLTESTPARCPKGRGGSAKSRAHTPRRATSTRTTRARIRRAAERASAAEIIMNGSVTGIASRRGERERENTNDKRRGKDSLHARYSISQVKIQFAWKTWKRISFKGDVSFQGVEFLKMPKNASYSCAHARTIPRTRNLRVK